VRLAKSGEKFPAPDAPNPDADAAETITKPKRSSPTNSFWAAHNLSGVSHSPTLGSNGGGKILRGEMTYNAGIGKTTPTLYGPEGPRYERGRRGGSCNPHRDDRDIPGRMKPSSMRVTPDDQWAPKRSVRTGSQRGCKSEYDARVPHGSGSSEAHTEELADPRVPHAAAQPVPTRVPLMLTGRAHLAAPTLACSGLRWIQKGKWAKTW
jgi:hypothetical protein